MAKFTTTVPLDTNWLGMTLRGPAGTIHRIPDAFLDEFEDQLEVVVGLANVTWLIRDELDGISTPDSSLLTQLNNAVNALDSRITTLETNTVGATPPIPTQAQITALANRITALEISHPTQTVTPALLGGYTLFPLANITVAGNTALPVGGSAALRGQKSFTLTTATATASGGTVAAVHAARDAAGAGGVVRITANVSGTIVMSVASQTWELAPGVTITGRVDFQANYCTFRGGNVAGGFYAPRSPLANNITIQNVKMTVGSFGNNCIALEGGHSNWTIDQFEITDPGADFIRAWYDQAADSQPNGMTISNGIMLRTAAWGTRASHGFGSQGPSALSGNDGNNSHQQKNFLVHNCYIDNGTGAQGGMGIEWWNHESAGTASGRGGIVQYSDLRGGQDHLCSMVRSRDNWIHHNKFRLRDGAFSCYEAAGSGVNDPHVRGFFEDNAITSTLPFSGVGIYHNNGALNMTVQYNSWDGTAYIVGGCCNGGGYTIKENKLLNGTTGLMEGSFPTATTFVGANSSSGAGPR